MKFKLVNEPLSLKDKEESATEKSVKVNSKNKLPINPIPVKKKLRSTVSHPVID